MRIAIGVLCVSIVVTGCGLFGSANAPKPASTAGGSQGAAAGGTEAGTEASPDAPKDPFDSGVLKSIVSAAPPRSASQYLAVLAGEFGWEAAVNQDLLLRQAVAAGEFAERVEPRLLGLFFKQGFSVLPSVGEGHEFSRDSVVRGPVANRFFLVRAKGPVRIIFLEQTDNVVIIYAKNAEQPQIFSRVEASTVAVRESRSGLYLN